MNAVVTVLLAVLSIWDYPSRFPEHERLRREFVAAVREGDTEVMVDSCRKGVKLLPDDPTWQYNLACSLAYFKDQQPALEALEKAIDLGFRDADAIAKDNDLRRLEGQPRFKELVEYAKEMSTKPILAGPAACVSATGIFGETVALGEHNMSWNFDVGCFEAKLKLAAATTEGNVGDLYMNRDAGHSALKMVEFPGLTEVRLDETGRRKGVDLNAPNILFPYPVFGNSSRAFLSGPYWRSLPRSLMTAGAGRMNAMVKMYLSNQTWAFPACWDVAPVETNGDVFASITPYWIATAGRSWSDLPYVKAALLASRSFRPEVKKFLTDGGLLAPTIQTLIRKSLTTVSNETDYLSYKAHPTAFPKNGVDLARLGEAARTLSVRAVPPLAPITLAMAKVKSKSPWPELTYASPFACALVLRADDEERTFLIQARGAEEFEFVQTHGQGVKVTIEKIKPDVARVVLNRKGMSPINRVDVAVFGRNRDTAWGAPSYVSFARMDPEAPYSDPMLTTLGEPKAK